MKNIKSIKIVYFNSQMGCLVPICCVFRPAFGCLQHPEADRNIFFSRFSTFFVYFVLSTQYSIIYMFWPALGCCKHPEAGRNTQHPSPGQNIQQKWKFWAVFWGEGAQWSVLKKKLLNEFHPYFELCGNWVLYFEHKLTFVWRWEGSCAAILGETESLKNLFSGTECLKGWEPLG